VHHLRTTANQINFSHFVIEKSTDGKTSRKQPFCLQMRYQVLNTSKRQFTEQQFKSCILRLKMVDE
jgi:hypothetical protein